MPAAGRRRRARRAGPHRRRPALRRRASRSRRSRPSRRARRCSTGPTRSRTPGSARRADLVVVAPATAKLLGKYAAGHLRRPAHRDAARDPCAGARVPGDAHRDVGAPGGAGEPRDAAAPGRARRSNPKPGRLAGGDVGAGRLADPERDRRRGARAPRRAARGPLAGVAGPRDRRRHARTDRRGAGHLATGRRASRATRSPRPRRGAARTVTLVTTVDRPVPPGIAEVVRVETAAEMQRRGDGARVRRRTSIVMAAAVADFRPKAPSDAEDQEGATARPRSCSSRPHDFLVDLGAAQAGRIRSSSGSRPRPTISSPHAADKLRRKRLDLIVGNDVGRPTPASRSTPTGSCCSTPHGGVEELPLLTKTALAERASSTASSALRLVRRPDRPSYDSPPRPGTLNREIAGHRGRSPNAASTPSRRSRSPRATPTRWRTRSATRCSTPSSREDPYGRVACETMVTTGLVRRRR